MKGLGVFLIMLFCKLFVSLKLFPNKKLKKRKIVIICSSKNKGIRGNDSMGYCIVVFSLSLQIIFLLTYLNIKIFWKIFEEHLLGSDFFKCCKPLLGPQCLILSGIESWKQSIDRLACNKNSLAQGTLTPPTFISVKSQISAPSSNSF